MTESVQKVTDAEAAEYIKQIPTWIMLEAAGEKRLEHVYKFKDFASALAFTNKVGALAEAEGHHPAILTEWGSVGVAWWTHSVGGLQHNDFLMAAKTDELYKTFEVK
ncbi:MAG: 4a-hydroxytetrahydrobiopterin dehydratase [Ktedonobacteraceae bacterium]